MTISLKQIEEAAARAEGVVRRTDLFYSARMSEKFGANIYLKREDLQEVRSFKIRGAYNKIKLLTDAQKKHGVVSASTGNHAQGVALSCALLKIKGVIFMPTVTPNQKISKVKHFGGKFVEIKLIGTTFDEAVAASQKYCETHKTAYIHPFDDEQTIAGQGTIGKEIYEQTEGTVDIVIAPIGGGGIVSGIASYLKQKSPKIQVYGAEAEGAASMAHSLEQKKIVPLGKFDTFVDGAAVNAVGKLTFQICKKYLEKVIVVPVGRLCKTMVDLYQSDGIIAEPAGALSIAALSSLRETIKGKTVVCVLSGGNNDLLRYPEIVEKSLVYQGLKHYFLVEFAQKPGQLRQFLNKALGPTDDIVFFEYIKRNARSKGPALIGVELLKKEDLDPLIKKMQELQLRFTEIKTDDPLYSFVL